MYPSQSYVVSPLSCWGGCNSCVWGVLRAVGDSGLSFPLDPQTHVLDLWTFRTPPIQSRRRGRIGIRGTTCRTSKIDRVRRTQVFAWMLGNATLQILLNTTSSREMKRSSPGDGSRCGTLPRVVSSGISSSYWGASGIRKREMTSEISGRRCQSWSQHCSVRFQISSVKFGCAGRSGRFPDKTSTATVVGLISGNGTFPVKIYAGECLLG